MLFFLCLLLNSSHAVLTVKTLQPHTPPPGTISDLRPWTVWRPMIAFGHDKKEVNGVVLFDNQVSHSPQGFRRYVDLPVRKHYDSHVFLGGCSFTYGEGLPDWQTFGYHLATEMPAARIVNMGRRGGYAADLLYVFKYFDWTRLYPEKSGVFVFTIIEDHFDRMRSSWRYLAWANAESPLFEFENKEWKYVGILGESWRYKLARFMKDMGVELYWLRLAHFFSAPDPADENRRMAAMLLELRKEYLRQFPGGRFVVSWFSTIQPRHNLPKQKEFIAQLRKDGIEYWDNTYRPEEIEKNGGLSAYIIKDDGHPTGLANREYATFLRSSIVPLQNK